VAAPWRVLYTIPNLDTAGSGAALLALAGGLDPDRYQATVCVAQRRGTSLEARADALGLDVVEAAVTVPGRPWSGLWHRARLAGRSAPHGHDLWHSFHYLDDYTEPLVARAAGCRRWVFTKKNMSWGSRAWWLRGRLAKGVATQNPTMVERFFPHRRRVRVIPPGVDGGTFHPGADAARRERLDVPADAVVVGHVAHLLPNKGQADLVRAVAGTAPEVHLVLAGRPLDEAYAAEVEALVDELGLGGRVRRLGAVDDVAGLLRACDVFAFASREEACTVAVLEAMATGLPVVTSDIPGTAHLVTDDEHGLRYPVADTDALARALTALAGDAGRRARLGAAGRARVEREFTLDLEAARYQDLYDEVLAV
jgi:glycosyltransferase involved in cell wall biosynthesis